MAHIMGYGRNLQVPILCCILEHCKKCNKVSNFPFFGKKPEKSYDKGQKSKGQICGDIFAGIYGNISESRVPNNGEMFTFVGLYPE